MIPQPPPGQGPIDPRGAFAPPPPPGGSQFPPPPGMYPPPPMFMPPPRQRGGGFARAIFMTLATTIFGISLALNIYLLIYSGFVGGSSSSRENSIVEGDPHEKVGVISVGGIIMDESAAKFEKYIDAAEHDANIKALVIEVDSPGGSVSASDEIYHRILQFKSNRAAVPVVVTMGGLAASGGYYISCGADYIFAEPTTLTGNIGVLMPRFNISKLFDKWGIEETTIASGGSPFKNAGSMFKPEDPAANVYIQDIADKAYAKFKSVVATGRKMTPAVVDKVADGKAYLADDALKLGLIDKIGYAPDAYDYAAQLAHLSKKTVVKYQDPPSLRDLLTSSSNIANPQARNVTINGVNIDAKSINEITTPRLMYLWRGN